MVVAVADGGKVLGTVRADIRPLSGVSSQVNGKISPLGEALAAVFAIELSGHLYC